MFSTSLRAALFALAATASAVVAAPGLSLKVTGPDAVDGVQNLKVVTTLTNTGDETLKLLNDPNGVLNTLPADTFTITTGSGAAPSFTGVRVKYSPSQAAKSTDASVFTVLAPGATVSITHDISSAYDFTKSGHSTYTVAASNTFLVVDANNHVSTLTANTATPHAATLTGGDLSVIRRPGLLRRVRGVSRRANYNGCSDSQQSDLNTAASDATNYAADASSYLDSTTSGTPRYTTWFGAYDDGRHSTVQSHFDNIAGNDFASFTYDCTCTDSGTFAYVYPDQFGTVYLCGAFWNAPATGSDSKAGTLVHEASHFTVNGGTKDYAYGQAAAQDLANSDPDKAVFNADNHEYFAENNPAQD